MKNTRKIAFFSLLISFVVSATLAHAYAGTVTPTYPANGSDVASVSPDVGWATITGASNYYVKYATSMGALDGAAETDVGTNTTYQITGPLANGQVYYWQVRADNANPSEKKNFTIDTSLANSAIQVDSITAVRTVGVAGGDYSNGWHFRYRITVYGAETNIQYKLADWTRTGGGTMSVANNVKVTYNGGDTYLTAAETYSTNIGIGDSDISLEGRQVLFDVYIQIPAGAEAGTYTSNYGIKSL